MKLVKLSTIERDREREKWTIVKKNRPRKTKADLNKKFYFKNKIRIKQNGRKEIIVRRDYGNEMLISNNIE